MIQGPVITYTFNSSDCANDRTCEEQVDKFLNEYCANSVRSEAQPAPLDVVTSQVTCSPVPEVNLNYEVIVVNTSCVATSLVSRACPVFQCCKLVTCATLKKKLGEPGNKVTCITKLMSLTKSKCRQISVASIYSKLQ